jgi:hypothetical protein
VTSYLENIEEKNFMDLVKEDDFKVDLVRFFSGGRYNMSKAEMKEQGFEKLAQKFAEHMRFQSAHDATALKDLNYVRDKGANILGKQSFGNLIQAWDNVESVGKTETAGWRDTATADYAEAIIKSPSTFLGMGSFGLSKAAAKAATKGTQILVRKQLKDYFTKNVMIKGAATGAVTEGAIGAATAGAAGEAREDLSDMGAYTEGYDYTTSDLAKDAAISATLGAAGGSLGALLTKKKAINVEELISQQQKTNAANAKKANAKSKETLENASAERSDFAVNRTLDMEATLAARKGDRTKGVLKDALDPDKVKQGEALKRSLLDTSVESSLSSGLDLTTLRSITAATIELAETIDLKPNERITSKISSLIDGGDIDVTKIVPELMEKYDLTNEQFSLIYLADLSEAGKKLAEASKVSRAVGKTPEVSASDTLNASLNTLSSRGLSTIDDLKAAEITANVIKNSAVTSGISKPVKYAYNTLQETDQMRIAFMTSQPATTSRNVTSTALLATVEILDEFYRGMYKTVRRQEGGGLGNTVRNMTATLRGMSMDSGTAQVAREMLEIEMPDSYARTFHETMRSEMSGQSQSAFAKAGRFVNILNTATDTVFKEAAFFGSLDRQLRTLNNKELGTNVKDFIINKGKLDKLDKSIVDKALDDANRFTMQRTYMGDESIFGAGARMASDVNKKLPFVMSGVFGVPFPRYVANHIEMIADYTPLLGEITNKLEKVNVGKGRIKYVTGDPYKSLEDRRVRQVTGASLIALGYVLAKSKEGKVDYKSLENEIKGDEDISSSLGFIIAPIFIGDQWYRYNNNLGLMDQGDFGMLGEVGSVMGGLNDMGADISGLRELYKSWEEDGVTEELEKIAGNIVSTFTYPIPFQLAKDIKGQTTYESAGAPYTRDLAKGTDVSSFETPQGTFLSRATRFLPDYATMLDGTKLQYSQEGSAKGYDVPYYGIFNPNAIGKMNPLKKTFTGLSSSPPKTEIEKEINKLGLKEYQLYGSSRVDNPVIDYFVRARLSQNLHLKFENFRSEQVPTRAKATQKVYDEITDIDEKREYFKAFINNEIKREVNLATDMLSNMLAKNPVKAAGYLRNVYYLKRAEYGAEKFNEAASAQTNGKYSTSQDYIADAESVANELERRQILMFRTQAMNPKGIN